MTLSLVILAAGAGSRFGGDKPVAAVGPDGQSLFEYSVYDAFRAGFKHVIFVVSEKQDTSVFADRLLYYGDELKVEFVVQSLTAFVKVSSGPEHPDGELKAARDDRSINSRIKPWGTAHALLVCRDYICNPFVVINADDYYGKENYRKIGHYLLENSQNPSACALPGYRLDNTLSNSGGVNRGVCEVDSDGCLESIREVRNIRLSRTKSLQSDNTDERLSIQSDSVVSMTFWGFVPAIFDLLETGFQSFLTETSDPGHDEFYLPDTVNRGIESGLLSIKVFDTAEKWKGLTYLNDLPEVSEYVQELTDAGLYCGLGVPCGEPVIEVATALIFDSDGKLLIYLRDDKPDIPFPGCWDLFGGHIEEGETPEVALVREVQEELGIDITNIQFFKTCHCMQGDVHPNIKHVFSVQISQVAAELTLYEGQYHKGIDISRRHDYQFANVLGEIIDDYVAEGK